MTGHLQSRSNPNYYARTGANGKRIREPIHEPIHSRCRVVIKSEYERAIRTEPNIGQHRGLAGWTRRPDGDGCGLLGAVSLMCYGRIAWTQATAHI